MSSSGSFPKLGILGHPVSHSLSPRIFGHVSKALKRPASYDLLDVPPARLAATFESLKKERYSGLNVTIPHKQAVLPLLSGLTDEARAIGAVNTVRLSDSGAKGHNTDAAGFRDSLNSLEFDPKGQDAVIFGAGGAARAVAYALGAGGAALVRVCGRDLSKAQELAQGMGGLFPKTEFSAGQAQVARLWVNATPLGMKGFPDAAPFVGEARCAVAFDLVYGRLTPFLAAGERAKAQTCDGLDMLVAQALRSWEFWFAPIAAQPRLILRAQLREALAHGS